MGSYKYGMNREAELKSYVETSIDAVWFKNIQQVFSSPRKYIRHARRNCGATNVETFVKLLESNDWRCFYCKTKLGKKNQPTKDHVVPISKGGINSLKNIVPSCLKCNQDKGDMDVWEFNYNSYLRFFFFNCVGDFVNSDKKE